jgi:outer membrane protein TolC
MSRKRWIKRILAILLAFGNGAGCKQQVFMEPEDYQSVMRDLPKGIENNVHEAIAPTVANTGKVPATVNDPDRPARMISLKECIAIALEQGNAGFQTPTTFGTKLEILPAFNGQSVTGTDSIRAFAIDPATQAAELERSLSKFDVQWINSLTWQKTDNPVAAQFLTFSSQFDSASISSTLVKPLPTGGVAAITFDTSYTKYANPTTSVGNFVNPNYVPQVQFTFEQPLLRLFGVEANELSPSHPGSTLLNIQPSGGVNTQGILLQRIHVDQQRANFDIQVNYLLANTEVAYWNLFAAYYNLYAQEEGLREAYLGYRFTDTRVQVGTDPSQNRDQARAQFERFRRMVIDARGSVLEAERQLRGFIGLRSDDGYRLVPIDEPNLAPYVPDFHEAANDAMANRPELLQCRQDLKVQQLNLVLQKNLRRPDLRFVSQYSIQGLGTRLDGSQFVDSTDQIPGNALTNMAADKFQNWMLGLRLTMPLGFRDANAFVREAQLSVARSYYQLRDSELKVLEYVIQQYRNVIQTHADIAPAREERKALQVYIAKIDLLISIGKWNPQDFLNYLTVQQQLATAIATEYQLIANYNNALAQFEFAKGTIQQYNNVTVGEGPLPPWAQKKAKDHIRERTEAALKLREQDISQRNQTLSSVSGQTVGPAVGTGFVEGLPPFSDKKWEPLPTSPDSPDMQKLVPMPQPVPPPSGVSNDYRPWLSPATPPGQPQTQTQNQSPLSATTQPLAPTPPMPMQPSVPTPPIRSQSLPQSPAMPGTSIAPNAGSEDYFRSVGTVSLPNRSPNGTGGNIPPVTVPSVTPTPPPSLPAGTGMNPLPLPSLPAGSGMSPLPIPPTGSSLPTPSAPAATVEFGPLGSVAPLGSPPVGGR